MSDLKNLISNIIAVVIVVATAIEAYLATLPTGGEINWWTLVIGVAGAVIAWLTGKGSDGKKLQS